MIVRRVIPQRRPRRRRHEHAVDTANRFAAVHSATAPGASSITASLMPAAVAWRFASTASM